jgi:dephospho-CoA kinase
VARQPCLVGLTGGLASGKSTVGRLLSEREVPLFDADTEVHRLYQPGEAGAAAVAEVFGAGVLTADGGVDRGELARRVVGDGAALQRLNEAVHPLVRASVERWVAELAARDEPPSAVVVEAALLVETGAARGYDVLLVVGCRAEQQLERATARGMDPARARGLLAAQLPMADKVAAADVVVDNSGTRDELPGEVERAWREVLKLCAARRA